MYKFILYIKSSVVFLSSSTKINKSSEEKAPIEKKLSSIFEENMMMTKMMTIKKEETFINSNWVNRRREVFLFVVSKKIYISSKKKYKKKEIHRSKQNKNTFKRLIKLMKKKFQIGLLIILLKLKTVLFFVAIVPLYPLSIIALYLRMWTKETQADNSRII